MKLGILNADKVNPKFSPEFGEYPDMFAEMFKAVDPDVELVTYEVVDGEYPQDLDEVDGFIITGSKFSVYDDVPWIHQLKAFVKKLHHNKKKLVGICFGHQMVAEALGGNVSKADSGWSIGVQSNSLSEDSQAYGLRQESFLLRANHQDQVSKLPSGAKALAGNEACPIAAMGIEDHILTFQGHPEFSKGYARALLDFRREVFGEEHYRSAVESLENDPDNLQITSCILDFVSAK